MRIGACVIGMPVNFKFQRWVGFQHLHNHIQGAQAFGLNCGFINIKVDTVRNYFCAGKFFAEHIHVAAAGNPEVFKDDGAGLVADPFYVQINRGKCGARDYQYPELVNIYFYLLIFIGNSNMVPFIQKIIAAYYPRQSRGKP